MIVLPLPRYAFRHVLLVGLLLWVTGLAHAADRRIALVIGNSAYQNAPLYNPGNDARAMAEVLREDGFTVTEKRNVSQSAMRRAIRKFGDELKKGGVGLFYYAGHGMQVRGRNYLIPVGTDIQREDEIEDQAVDASLVLRKMATAGNKMNIVILDACRNNPFVRTFRSATVGLAAMDAPVGTIIAFSTAPGQVAADGTGENSLYTQHLVAHMREPGLKVEDVFKRVRAEVRSETAGKQIPWENTSLVSDFYFNAPDTKLVDAAETEERRLVEQAAIEKAVQEALKRNSRKAAQDRAKFEREIAEKVATEREASERAAAKRIAAIEKSLQAALARSGGQAQSGSNQAAPTAAPQGLPEPEPGSPQTQPSEKVASAASSTLIVSAVRSAYLPKVGDAWTYRIIDRDYNKHRQRILAKSVVAVTAEEIRTKFGKGTFVYDHNWNPVRIERPNNDNRKFEPFVPVFSFPLEPGKTWHQKYKVDRHDQQFEYEGEATVEGWEDVTVPAGTFRALKISSLTSFRRVGGRGGRGTLTTTTWYSPVVGTYVKRERLQVAKNNLVKVDDTQELVSYKHR